MGASSIREEVTRLAIHHRVQLWAFVLGLAKDLVAAEDLMQETYLVILEKWDTYKPGTNFLAWAWQIARYRFLQSVDPARRGPVTLEGEVLETALDRVAEPAERLQLRREALARCLEEIKGTKGERAIELRYQRNLSCPQIARQLTMSLDALYKLLSRVREALQGCTERRLLTVEG